MVNGQLEAKVYVDLKGLWASITERHLAPEDPYEVVALLESMGWTDSRVGAQSDFADVFDLADYLWSERGPQIQIETKQMTKNRNTFRFRDYLYYLLRGTIFALPMLFSVASMLTLRFSLWSYQYLSVRLATVIAIGTILSFLTVGGFMQAIARRGFFYLSQGYFRMARQITIRFISAGIAVSIMASLALILLNFIFPLLPADMLFICLAYYLVLNSIWLAVAVMYVLKSELIFTGLLILGIACVYLEFKVFHINILVAQLIAMFVISFLSTVIVLYQFQRAERKGERGIRPRLPRPGITVYSITPYFLYGFLYFALLFSDRIIAWSTSDQLMPYFIWFRGNYELGLDFALIMLVIPLGVSELLVTKMMVEIESGQRMFSGLEATKLSDTFRRKYVKGMTTMVIVSIISGIVDYFTVLWVINHHVLSNHQGVVMTPIIRFVFIVGIISYGILSVALLNAVTMFSLSRPDVVLRPLILSVVCNVLLGFVCSRWFHYDSAVWGLLMGSAIFAWLTTRNAWRVLQDLDYHLYLMS